MDFSVLDLPELNVDDDKYVMNHRPRGKAILINNETFADPDLTPRKASRRDVENMRKCLETLGFDVVECIDYSMEDIMKTMRKVAAEDHSDADCLIVMIASHGGGGTIVEPHQKEALERQHNSWECSYFTETVNGKFILESLQGGSSFVTGKYGKGALVEDITSLVAGDNCKTLIGKPKIFIIQTCRGEKIDYGEDVIEDVTTDGPSGSMLGSVQITPRFFKLPVHSDFLICYSCVEGYKSYRNPIDGSRFIKVLVQTLIEKCKSMDLLRMLTLVNRRVAVNFPRAHEIGDKQQPCFVSTLTKDLYFLPKLLNFRAVSGAH